MYNKIESGASLIKAHNLMHLDMGEAKIDIVYPEIIVEDSNNFSYYIKVEYNGSSLLFTGDADKTIENEVIKGYANYVDCDILKVAHHGSSTSSSMEFLNAVTPKYAVISVGKNNWGHPTNEVINNLKVCGVERILRTDIEGNILFSIDKKISFTSGENYVSEIEFGYMQVSWCLIFLLVCYGGYWSYINIGPLVKSKLKHNQ